MKAILVNFNFTPTWLLTSGLDYLVYDRSDSQDFLKDFPQDRIIYTENIGNVDYDKLTYLVDSYYDLPDVFVWGKTNLFKYITEEEYQKVANNKEFTPLLTQNHEQKVDALGTLCYYEGGMYHERNTMNLASIFNWKYAQTYNDFAYMFGLPTPQYIPFPPGGNFILTKDVVHKYSRDFYENMRNVLNYCKEPVEAQWAERSYYQMWK